MKVLQEDKDGGKESTVWAYWLIECKSLFSIALLKFVGDSREAYHTHAFNSVSWVLKGRLEETFIEQNKQNRVYTPSIVPIITTKRNFHKVSSTGTTWVLTFRGPWTKYWKESTLIDGEYTLTSGRKRVQ